MSHLAAQAGYMKFRLLSMQLVCRVLSHRKPPLVWSQTELPLPATPRPLRRFRDFSPAPVPIPARSPRGSSDR